tara:strand:- start:7659 stop:8081 length:423 start_codon:yes stop_codon:yes gene_type:complete
MANPLWFLFAAGVSAYGQIYAGQAAKASAKAQAEELRVQEQNQILNAIAEENEIVRANNEITQANLTMMQGGESDLAALEDNQKNLSKDVQLAKTKSLLELDSLRRTRIGVLQGGKMQQRASLIQAGGTLAGGYAKYKNA